MAHWGEAKTQDWMKGVVANFARSPGADTDQIKAVASAADAIALTNSYYLARLIKSSNGEDKNIAERVGVVFPDQASYGTHMNIARCLRYTAKTKPMPSAFRVSGQPHGARVLCQWQ